MQLWLRKFDRAYLQNVLCDERQEVAENGLEIHVQFEKGDRLKWIDELVRESFQKMTAKGMDVLSVVITCDNSELFERNWAFHDFGKQAELDGTLAELYLGSLANSLGMPLQWLIDEWQTLYPPRPYHRGLLKKYQRLIKQVEQQLLFRGKGKLYYRDPLLATCTDIELEYSNSEFLHLNSDEVIQPVWLILERKVTPMLAV